VNEKYRRCLEAWLIHGVGEYDPYGDECGEENKKKG